MVLHGGCRPDYDWDAGCGNANTGGKSQVESKTERKVRRCDRGNLWFSRVLTEFGEPLFFWWSFPGHCFGPIHALGSFAVSALF